MANGISVLIFSLMPTILLALPKCPLSLTVMIARPIRSTLICTEVVAVSVLILQSPLFNLYNQIYHLNISRTQTNATLFSLLIPSEYVGR